MQRTRQSTGNNSTIKTPSNQNLSASVNNGVGGDIVTNGLSHSMNFGSSDELDKSLSSGVLSASSSILQRLSNNKSEVGRSVENIMARVRSTPNAQQMAATMPNASNVMTKSVMVTSNSDSKMAPTSNGNDHSHVSRMTASMYDESTTTTTTSSASPTIKNDTSSVVDKTRFDADVSSATEKTLHDVDAVSAASFSKFADVMYNNGTVSSTKTLTTNNDVVHAPVSSPSPPPPPMDVNANNFNGNIINSSNVDDGLFDNHHHNHQRTS